jgi:hypothetical protein
MHSGCSRPKIAQVATLRSNAPLPNFSFKPSPLRGLGATSGRLGRAGLIQVLGAARKRSSDIAAVVLRNASALCVPWSRRMRRRTTEQLHLRLRDSVRKKPRIRLRSLDHVLTRAISGNLCATLQLVTRLTSHSSRARFAASALPRAASGGPA